MKENFQNSFYVSIIALIQKPIKGFTGGKHRRRNMLHEPSAKFLTEY